VREAGREEVRSGNADVRSPLLEPASSVAASEGPKRHGKGPAGWRQGVGPVTYAENPDRGSGSLEALLHAAEDQLWTEFEKSKVFTHPVIKGSEREGAIAKFLRAHLPGRLEVTTGQAVDASGRQTTQLDIVIYDSQLSAPLLRGAADLLPAEALLAVIEVKSKFTRAEARACLHAATSISRLRPYGARFAASRTGGEAADDGRARCLYSVLAYGTDLAERDWVSAEWSRLREVAREEAADVSRLDRLTILDRGMIVPPDFSGHVVESEKGVLREWFLHLTDFLTRESTRRRPYAWHAYSEKPSGSGWVRLEGYKPPARVGAKTPGPKKKRHGRRRRR
jgi:hypothetical protein